MLPSMSFLHLQHYQVQICDGKTLSILQAAQPLLSPAESGKTWQDCLDAMYLLNLAERWWKHLKMSQKKTSFGAVLQATAEGDDRYGAVALRTHL
jgi:hypothetical protein